MKRISKYFLCLFAVVLTAGCAEDKLGETEFDPTVYEGDKAYMTVQVTMPSVPGSAVVIRLKVVAAMLVSKSVKIMRTM